LGRSSLAGIGGKTPPVKVIFNVNVVLDVYDTDGARPCEKPVCKKCASASTSREQKS
jgi:hypothetical protein